ncbi:Aminopeptidase N [Rubrivivax sp. A210]|uniref:aminopeptidase N n=1 Tax=Rubrivivax sp. A210 TaxID=2772301 RepID=UPI001919A917|nr:aminopeptidase N [Rubrivivax sp. A210]CAD5374894.1 Aminopeptidase N [Rubrivivax sp. A210]
MREASTAVVQREDYSAPAFFIRQVDLTFDLDPAKTIVASRLAIERNPAQPAGPLRLHGEGLNLLRVQADGQSVSFRHEAGELVIDNPPAAAAFTLEIRNTCCPEKNTELSGLYTSGGGFFTQCEAEGFRRITFFLDRPDVMAVYTVTLRGDKARFPVLLSNGNLVEQGDLDHGRHYAKWHDPFPKPSYLFALVAARLVCREQRIRSRGGRDHLLQIHVRPGDLQKTEHAMNSLVAAVAWDEARFGLALDLDRFMVVAVEDYNGGAMENKGLNLFNTKLLLASPASATDDDFAAIESVVGHEYFHNWTGNRITCRDWFQLSLKEGLTVFRDQEFSMDMAGDFSARGVKRIADVQRLRSLQFPEDAGPMAHPVRPDRYLEINNFYTTTVYEKGAEVVRMMHTLVGRDGFRAGMDLYFARHDGQAVTCDDFAQAIADANPGSVLARQLEAFKRWYGQAGTPRVTASGTFDAEARRYTLTLAQSCPPSPAQPEKLPFVIPVDLRLIAADGTKLTPLRTLVLDSAEQSWVFDDIAQAPVPSLLRGFSAPVRLDDGLTSAQRLVLLAHDCDPFNRFEAGQRLVLDALLAALRDGGAPRLDEAVAAALRRTLRDPGLAPAFKKLVLLPPAEAYIAEQLTVVDPQRIHAVREHWRALLAASLHEDWLWAWEQHQVAEGYSPAPDQAGRRALAGLALDMLCLHAVRQGDATWPGRAYQRFKDAGNLTERMDAIGALVRAQSPLAEPALERLHALAQGDALMLDRWFALQASAPEPVAELHGEAPGRVFARAKALLKHPDFSLKNPNRTRSLLTSLCGGNPAAFHRADAAGYVLWAERLIELDAINAHVAGRFARVMDRWASLAEPYRHAAREAIARVAARTDLSNDVREVVTRALENA